MITEAQGKGWDKKHREKDELLAGVDLVNAIEYRLKSAAFQNNKRDIEDVLGLMLKHMTVKDAIRVQDMIADKFGKARSLGLKTPAMQALSAMVDDFMYIVMDLRGELEKEKP